MITKSLTLVFLIALNSLVASPAFSQGHFALTKTDDGVTVSIGEDLFTRLITTDETKPLLYPVFGPNQVPMTRGFPLEEKDGEAHDHPHHKSVWVGHEVNGMDFWANRDGIIRFDSIAEFDQDRDSFTVQSSWISKEGEARVCTVLTKYHFGFDETSRWIDVTNTFKATDGDLTFDDTKEGLFAIRSHSDLRLSPSKKDGVNEVFGQAINSEGVTGKEIWGKAAKWVSYWGEVEGEMAGFAILDHPTNFRHPTHWHAREYGLVAANPFGLHHFTGADKGTGEHTVEAGESLTFRHRLVLYSGDHESANIDDRFNSYAEAEMNW